MNINQLAQKYEDFKESFKRHSTLQLKDDSELMIDNCKKVFLYDEDIIKIALVKNTIIITGAELKMRNFNSDNIIIKGEIKSIKLERQK